MKYKIIVVFYTLLLLVGCSSVEGKLTRYFTCGLVMSEFLNDENFNLKFDIYEDGNYEVEGFYGNKDIYVITYFTPSGNLLVANLLKTNRFLFWETGVSGGVLQEC